MIYISAGHRGPKTGATGLIDEGRETIRLRNALVERMMMETASNANIRTDEDGAELAAVIRDVNRWCGDASRDFAVEIHFNSAADPQANGTECIIADRHSRRSEEIARAVNETICRVLGTRDRTNGRGWKTEGQSARGVLGFVRQTKCPAVIVEVCFVGSAGDVRAYYGKFSELADKLAETLRGISV